MSAVLPCAVLAFGLIMVVSGLWEQIRRPSLESPEIPPEIPRVGIRIQEAGLVTREQVVRAAEKFHRALKLYGNSLPLDRNLVEYHQLLTSDVLRAVASDKRVDAASLFAILQIQLFNPLERIVFNSAATTSNEEQFAQRLAKRALVFLTLLCRYQMAQVFYGPKWFGFVIDRDVRDIDSRIVALQSSSVTLRTRQNGRWTRIVNYPVRIFAHQGREFPVFCISRGANGIGRNAFQEQAALAREEGGLGLPQWGRTLG